MCSEQLKVSLTQQIPYLLLLLLVIPFFFPEKIHAEEVRPRPLTFREEVRGAKRLPMEKGERCIVCGKELEKGDPVFLIRGRRLPVKKGVLDEFLADPAKYFTKVAPKSALFTESHNRTQPDYTWFFIGVSALLTIVTAGFIAYMRMSLGESLPNGYTKTIRTHQPGVCPNCGASHHPAAKTCAACGSELSPTVSSEVAKLR